MLSELRPALVTLLVLSCITGIAYPLLVTVAGQALFGREARGSLLEKDGKPAGSALVGQPFAQPKYFWSRASGTGPYPYNASASSGTNQGPLNPALKEAVESRVKALREADPGNTAPVPVDLVTASASGLDPHISPAAAEYQVARVARVRAIPADRVRALVTQATEGRQLGLLGEPRVNVLRLNLLLDQGT